MTPREMAEALPPHTQAKFLVSPELSAFYAMPSHFSGAHTSRRHRVWFWEDDGAGGVRSARERGGGGGGGGGEGERGGRGGGVRS